MKGFSSMIRASEYIKTGFSANDAECLGAIVEPMVGQGEKIQIDFSNIKIFTTLFLGIIKLCPYLFVHSGRLSIFVRILFDVCHDVMLLELSFSTSFCNYFG